MWNVRRAKALEWAAAGWNLTEALLALIVGGLSGSAALISFGLSSFAELGTGFVALHELRHGTKYWMHRALAGFFAIVALAAVSGGVYALQRGPVDGPGGFSILVAGVSFTMMNLIAVLQLRAGRALRSTVLIAHAKMSFLDSGLAAAVLVGLLLWSTFSVWWADAAAALVVALIAAKESYESLPDSES
jgi:divalent metal cation (Fe/Co/Zn/Cd) transporter